MKIGVHVVGRMKAGPERELADRFFDRFAKAGPNIGLEFSGIVEISESRARSATERQAEEAGKIAARAADAVLILLDERGRDMPSRRFAERLGTLRDAGTRELVIAIGGPDGHDPALRQKAAETIAFGTQTWPHQLVRVMLAEQLYRAASILAGHPYHRE
jgi:23S rRNA (pseudouridine1915-N3)-methyltransferase